MSDYVPKVYKKAGGDIIVVASGGKIEVESGGEIELQSGAIADLVDKVLQGSDIALANGKFLVGDSSGIAQATTPADALAALGVTSTAAELNILDGVTADKDEINKLDGAGSGGTPVASKVQIADANQNIGAVKATSLAIGTSGAEVAITATPAEINTLDRVGAAGAAEASKAVVLDANKAQDVVRTASLRIGASGSETELTATPAQLNALAAALTAGALGSSNAYAKTDDGTKTLLAAHATKARGVLVIVQVTEALADGDGAQPVLEIGEADTIDKCVAHTVFVGAAVGTYVFGFLNTATKAILATLTAGTGTTETGAFTITVLALPNS